MNHLVRPSPEARRHFASQSARATRLVVVASLSLFAACDSGGETGSTPGSVTETVTASGGTVAAGSVEAVIPAGALAADVVISIAPVAATVAALPADLTAVGDILAFTPHGTTFAVPVTLKLPYVGDADTVLRLDNESDTTWEVVEGAVFADGVASVQTMTFSLYVVTNKCSKLCKHGANVCGVPATSGLNGACVTACGSRARLPSSPCQTELDAVFTCYEANTNAAQFECSTTLLPTAANCETRRLAAEQCLNPTPANVCPCFTKADLDKALVDATAAGGVVGVGAAGVAPSAYGGCAFGKDAAATEWGTQTTTTSLLFIALEKPPADGERYFGWFAAGMLDGIAQCLVWQGDSSPKAGPTPVGPKPLTSAEWDGCNGLMKDYKAAQQNPAWTCFEQH